MTVKLIALLKRRHDVSFEEFCRYYEREHAPLFMRSIPADVASAIISYVQNHALLLGSGTTGPPFDSVAEFTFEDLAGLQRWKEWYEGVGGKVLRDDEERFMDRNKRVVIVTEEHRIPQR